ncbi:MAG: WD40/YVTN/BNR-like repeat-containing protein [bacterium JZ-2024 1]
MASILVGTTSGGYLYEHTNGKWRLRNSFLEKESVSHFAVEPRRGTIYASTLTDGVYRSTNSGRTWTRLPAGLHIKKTWTLVIHPSDSKMILCGTHYGHIFRSEDGGKTWKDMEGFYKAPGRDEAGVDWGFGTTGHCIHTLIFDPRKPSRIFAVSSGGGPYRSEDEGTTWTRIREGMAADCPNVSPHEIDDHLKFVHSCVHRMVHTDSGRSQTLFIQNHCGVYRSDDLGNHWQDISKGLPGRHGFPICAANARRSALFVVPAYQGEGWCKRHNSCIKGPLEVWRSDDKGATWQSASSGLPPRVHTCVLRHAMDSGEGGLIGFGTTGGHLFISGDLGESWQLIATGLGRIQSVVIG